MKAAVLLLAMVPTFAAAGVVGGWNATAPLVRVAVPGRVHESAPLRPANPAAGTVDKVTWQYRLPPGVAVRAWLCGDNHCVEAGTQRGQTHSFAGQDATTPLHFRFALLPHDKEAVVISDLQVMVSYR